MRLNSWLGALLALSWLLFAPFLLFPVESEGSGDVFFESLLGPEARLPEDLWLQGGLASSQRLAGPCIMSNCEYGLHTHNIKFLLHMMHHACHRCMDSWQTSAGDQWDYCCPTDLWGRHWCRRALAR